MTLVSKPPRPIIEQMSGGGFEEGGPALMEVVWRRFGQHVLLTFAGASRPEHLNGDFSLAATMAEEAGLAMAESSPAMARWVRDLTCT